MAEKKHGLGTVLLVGAAAAAVAGGVASYIKRAEIKRLAEDIITRVRPADENIVGDWDIHAGTASEEPAVDPAEPNIVDSGLSLESVGDAAAPVTEPEPATDETEAEQESDGPETEEEAEPETRSEAEAAPVAGGAEESGETDGEQSAPEPAEPEAAQPETEQPKKKTWFWSK